ncbi:Microtubule-binding protein MIP-T3 [Novymonas esmeraldas]|uniref:Microtubule-binding protein MIP-T3 n=1 Tax=Novymonas esmeraldas TaxID=1808958 RepID=A0AAW0F0M0_9TRYP
MADGEVDFWSATMAAFQPLQLPSPELNAKLLKRPPFRFIHDIVCAIDVRFAAYGHKLPADMRDSAQVDTKEKKVKYLTILIDYLGQLMKVELDVNPKKIVAGQEPEKTNLFLQYLAAGVGYAQQDKATQPAAAAPKRSSTTSTANSLEHAALPSPSTLPRKRSEPGSTAAARRSSHTAALGDADRFNSKLSGYSLNLNLNDGRDIRADGQSMVRMWNELAHPQVETKPSHMPAEALETAIKRQIETIKMVQELLKENEGVIDTLEALVT